MKSKWTLAATIALAAFLGLAGCEGDDGKDGAAGLPGAPGDVGDQGPPGPPGDNAVTTPVESCSVCHSEGAFADAAMNHALPPLETISNVAFAEVGDILSISFTIAVDGDPSAAYNDLQRLYVTEGTTRFSVASSATLVNDGGGNYTVDLDTAAANLDTTVPSRYVVRVAIDGDSETRAYVVGDYPEAPFTQLVSDESCQACHGAEGEGFHFASQMGASQCLVCHGRDDAITLGELVHSIHNSANFPGGEWEFDEEHIYHVTYPTYMTNCSVCHDSGATLAAANTLAVSPDCFSCHGSTATMFAPSDPFAGIHANIVTGCDSCHVAGGVAGAVLTVTDVHNGLLTERGGIIWDGVDTSVVEGDKITWLITDVVDDGTNLEISWTASYEGVGGVDPCNATAGPTAPVFFADGAGNLSILRNYAQGGDYILGTSPDAPQPSGQVNVTAANTTCAQGVATTVVPVEATDAMYGRVAIQGKPRLPSVANPAALMAVRAFTPTFDWVVGEGGAAPARRDVVDSGLCVQCHVGSMYQHGGNRVDNVDMCYLCHNPAANDQFVRTANFGGVDASEAYDGKAGQNFGMKEMLHAVHSAGATGAPIVIYRGRGIYAWAGSVDDLQNWPTESDCVYGTNNTPGFTVVGSDPATATSNTCQPHIFHTPTYPRLLNDCAACHVEGFALLPGADVAMASTVETGDAPFGDQLNDVLEGALASSCMTCHRSDDPAVEAVLKAHAYQNGWVPQELPEGRQTIIEAVR